MRLSSFERKSSVRVRHCMSQPRISSERKTNNVSPSLTGWPSSTATRLMMACRGDCIGSAPVAGIRTNWQWTVSGNRITISTSSANRKAASNSQAVERMIQDGGSCGSISDSTSSEPRSVNCELIEIFFRFRVAGSKGSNTNHAAPLTHHGCQPRQHFLFQARRSNALPEWCSSDAQLQSSCARQVIDQDCPESRARILYPVRSLLHQRSTQVDCCRSLVRWRCVASDRRTEKDLILQSLSRNLAASA